MYDPEKQYDLKELLNRADAGDLDAMSDLVVLFAVQGYINNSGEQEIRRRYFSYLKILAGHGESWAEIMLGDAYLNGTGTERNPKKALLYYEKAANNGEAFGYECIGMMYYVGECVPRDFQKAFEYFTKVKGSKSFCTYFALGEMYRTGSYVRKDNRTACRYFKKIAYSKDEYAEIDDYYRLACFRLGCAFHYGFGVKRDLNAAIELLKTARRLWKKADDDESELITEEEFLREWAQLHRDAGMI